MMKTIVVVLLTIAIVVQTAITGPQAFTAYFNVSASQYNHGYFNGQIDYDWSKHSFILTFLTAELYFELYTYDVGNGYNESLSNGQYSGQFKYKNSELCDCEITSLQTSMPLFFIDNSVQTPVWVKDPNPQNAPNYNGSICIGYSLNPSINATNQIVTYFWMTSNNNPCGFTFVDGRQFVFSNVQTSPIPSTRFTPPIGCKCGEFLDIVVCLDRSGSIMIWEWYDQQNFTLNLVQSFDYGPLKTNMGIVNFNTNFWKTIDLVSGITSNAVVTASNAMDCCVSSTNIYASCCCCGTSLSGGLYYAAQMMLNSSRLMSNKVIILVTDGCQNHMSDITVNPPSTTACVCPGTSELSCETSLPCMQDLTQKVNEVYNLIPAIKIISVGVGNSQQICYNQLVMISGTVQNIFQPQSWENLSSFIQSISATICGMADPACNDCCGICSCGSCIKPTDCTPPDKCTIAVVDSNSQCCSLTPMTCPPQPCYSVSCDPLQGCVYTTLPCPPTTNCTTWSCDNGTSTTVGMCQLHKTCDEVECHIDAQCNDNSKCTIDKCVNNTCTFTTFLCGVSDNCTKYSCDPLLGCSNNTLICNDFNKCTNDSCVGSVLGGCVFSPIMCPKSNDSCLLPSCGVIIGCYTQRVVCNLNTTNCTIASCMNGTCRSENVCLPPPPSGMEENYVQLTGLNTGTVAGCSVAAFVLVLILLIFLSKRYGIFTHAIQLPPEISWSFEETKLRGDKKGDFKMKQLKPDSKGYSTVLNLFNNYLGGENICISEILAVYPKHLLQAFTIYEQNQRKRLTATPHLFQHQQWKKNDPIGLRQWEKDRFDKFTNSFPWNIDRTVKIIPQIHGTDFQTAMVICNNGFATLSLLDEGWYGKGIYFTSSGVYATPYFATKQNPVIMVAYVIPGNPYPVTEHPKSEKNMVSAALQSGSQSHYVVTSIDGYPVDKPQEDCYDELVITQEAQVLPAFILVIDNVNLNELLVKFQREIAENKVTDE